MLPAERVETTIAVQCAAV